jgi:hypothetical protein
MRTPILLLAALCIAACDTQQPTAPAKARSLSPSGSAAGQLAPSPQAKPTDQVGFTTVTAVSGPNVTVFAGKAVESDVLCPAGSVVVGGTYRYVFFDATTTPPWIFKNDTDGTNGWSVTIVNQQPGAFQLTYKVIAYCAS